MGQRCTGGISQAPEHYVVATPRDSGVRPDGKVVFYSKNNRSRLPTEEDDSLEYEDNVTEKVSTEPRQSKVKFADENSRAKKRQSDAASKTTAKSKAASGNTDSEATLKDYMQKREKREQTAGVAPLSCVTAPISLLSSLFTDGSFCPPPTPPPATEAVDQVPVRHSGKPPSPTSKP